MDQENKKVQGWHKLTDEEYFSDPGYSALQASSIKNLLRSPAHYQAGLVDDSQTPAMEFGTALHNLILEPELGQVVEAPDCRRGTKEWNAFEAENEGKLLLKPDEFRAAKMMQEELFKNKTAKMLLQGGRAEITGFVQFPKFWGKCKVDYLLEDINVLVDYKTTTDARLTQFSKKVIDYGYDISAAWYLDLARMITGEYFEYVFIAQEKTPPFAVQVFSTPAQILMLGSKKIVKAIEIYEKCLETNEWPAYPDELTPLTVPAWALNE